MSGTLMSVFGATIAAAVLSVIRVHAQRLRASNQREGLIRYFAPVERLIEPKHTLGGTFKEIPQRGDGAVIPE
jgi:hypothetical protein